MFTTATVRLEVHYLFIYYITHSSHPPESISQNRRKQKHPVYCLFSTSVHYRNRIKIQGLSKLEMIIWKSDY